MIINEENYVEKAEQTIQKLNSYKNPRTGHIQKSSLTTSQIRNLLAMSADIYNMVVDCPSEELSEDIVAKIRYLKVRMIYEAGRTPAVRSFVEKAELLTVIDQIQKKKQNYILYSRYMEALVAYHRFLNGND